MYRRYVQHIREMGCAPSTSESSPSRTEQGTTSNTVTNSTSSTTATVADQNDVPPAPPVPNPQPVQGTSQPGQSTNSAPAAKKSQLTEEQKEAHKKWTEEKLKEADDLKKKIEETMAMLAKFQTPSKEAMLAQDTSMGKVDIECPSPAKIVRIFTSSTFTDTMYERNILMQNAYPRVKAHCRRIGYEFQVVDMRWGVRDEATDDHMGTELCMKELKLCQQISTGPNFVSLLSHKYGYTAFPRLIEAEEFEKLMDAVEPPEVKTELFHKWYTRDDNQVPASYVLASISTHLPGFLSNDPEEKKSAKTIWWEESEKMQTTIGAAAAKAFDAETARKYIMSITEAEVQEGLMKTEEASKHGLWLRRTIDDIEDQESSYALSRYIECLGPEEKWKKSRQLLKELKEEHMQKKLNPDNILDYNVHWNGGINPAEEEHKQYLEKMNDDFVQNMTTMIDKSVAERKKSGSLLTDELCQHTRFCQIKCKGFVGRDVTMKRIEEYVKGNSKTPLIIHAASGTGKTSVMAMAAKMARTWMKGNPAVVFRFLGTTSSSSSLRGLLESIVNQIRQAYRVQQKPDYTKLNILAAFFKVLLAKSRPNQPLLLILDSLDQLDPSFNARQLEWLPKTLIGNVKIIVSTLPEPVYECMPALKSLYPDEENYFELPVLNDDDVQHILNNWLSERKRTLTDKQMNIVTTTFQKCQTPLFLKLAFDEAVTWTSFAPVESTILQATVRSSIEFLFQRLEKLHGKILVSRALGYLTLAHNGATEAELEDILSCDDDVLNDVYMYWTPPMRRLPPLLLVRIRTDLSEYLVERGADGVRVIYWYHRQFIEAAEARYCSDPDNNKIIHSNLADFYHGTWTNGQKKPYVSSRGESGNEDRHVADQPFRFSENVYNLRRLNNVPYHRAKADQLGLLLEQSLTNVDFLIHKMKALSLMEVLDDYTAAVNVFPNNNLLSSILAVLQLSQKGLITDPGQLVPQLLGRLPETKATADFLDKCRDCPRIYLEPSRYKLQKPGGRLMHSINAHKSDIDMVDLTQDSKYAVTVCQSEKEVHLWDIEKGKLLRSVNGIGQCTMAYFCNKDQWVAMEVTNHIQCEPLNTGRRVCTLTFKAAASDVSFCVAGPNKEYAVVFIGKTINIYDFTDEGKLITTLMHPENMKFGALSIPRGSPRFVAVCDADQYFVTVLDLSTKKFLPKFRGFPTTIDEDGDTVETEVEAICILPGKEPALVYTNMMTSEVIFCDLLGSLHRTIPENKDISFRSLECTSDGRHIMLHDAQLLKIYDTQTLKESKPELKHAKDVVGAKCHDMVTCVTVAQDSILRIWDMTKEPDNTQHTRCSIPFAYFSRVLQLTNSRYMLVLGSEEKSSSSRTLVLYDVLKDKVVRQCAVPPEVGNVSAMLTLGADRPYEVIMWVGHRLYLLDLIEMKLKFRFQGVVNQGFGSVDKSVHVIDNSNTNKKSVIALSRGRMNLKIYDSTTGKVESILKAGQKKRIEHVSVNSTSTVAAALTDEGPIIVFDLIKRQHRYTCDRTAQFIKAYDEYMSEIRVNAAGTRLLFDADAELPGTAKLDSVAHMVMWDIDEGKEVGRMFDAVDQKRLQATKSDDSTSIDEVLMVDYDNLVFTTGFDNVVRIYDQDTGSLKHRLRGHTTNVKLALNQSSPYVLSYGSYDEEDCLRLWKKDGYTFETSFTLDESIESQEWSSDGKFFITHRKQYPADIVTWRIKYGHDHVSQINEEDYPAYFDEQVEDKTVYREPIPFDTGDDKGKEPEPDDPDSDPEEPEDDVEDNDDDDDANED